MDLWAFDALRWSFILFEFFGGFFECIMSVENDDRVYFENDDRVVGIFLRIRHFRVEVFPPRVYFFMTR